MATFGDKTEPGIVTDLSSALNVGTAGAAPSDLGIVGQADLASTGSDGADPNIVYEVTRATQARTLFGPEASSLLTQGIIDALIEGAFPVYALAPEEIDVAGEDISGVAGTSGTLSQTPVIEDAASISFTVDGVAKTTVLTYEDPSTKAPGADEVYVNPVTGAFELDVAPSDTDTSNDTADYTYYDYPTAIDAMVAGAGDTIDFFQPINENQDVVDYAQSANKSMAAEYDLALAVLGPGDTVIDPATYTQSYDDSRAQVVFGTRFEDNSSLLAAYAGKRAALGLTRTPIGLKLESTKRMASYQASLLDRTARGQLIDANVVPLADEAGGIRIVDDKTTVTSSNAQEGNIDFGFTRLVMDYIITITRANEQPFIGRLNNGAVRDAFADLVKGELVALKNSGSVLSYTVNVAKVDATTASLEVGVEVAKPLRFIENKITVGSTA